MTGSTKQRLAAAAAELLDRGGQAAVTLRAVAESVGVSHNAPYRHFRGRSALLAGVALQDFHSLDQAFRTAMTGGPDAASALRRATDAFISYALAHPARYRLLFSDPALPADDDLAVAAMAPFATFVAIVSRCQQEGVLPPGDPVRLAGMIYATMHGAIDLQIGGRASDSKGLGSVDATVDLLLHLLGTVPG